MPARWSRKGDYDGFSTKPAPAPAGPPMKDLMKEARARRVREAEGELK